MLPLGLILAFLYIRQNLDILNMRYKEHYWLLGLKFGRWKPIPKVDYISVFPEKMVQRKNVVSISSSHSEKNYKVDLIISSNERISAAKYAKKEQALDKGKELARSLKCKLLDNTTGKAIWIDLLKAE